MAEFPEWPDENAARAYPLHEDGCPAALPFGFLLDLRLFLAADLRVAARLSRVDYAAAADTYHLVFAAVADDAVLLQGTVARQRQGASLVGGKVVLGAGARLAILEPGPAWDTPGFNGLGDWSLVFPAGTARLLESTAAPGPRGFRRFLVEDEVDDGAAPADATLTLIGGYNAVFSTTDDPAALGPRSVGLANAPVPADVVTVDAAPGLGAGYAPAAVAALLVRSFNGQGPDAAGNVLLVARDCLQLAPPVVSAVGGGDAVLPHTLTLANNCGPCCGCDRYRAVSRAISRRNAKLQDRCNTLHALLDQATNDYETIVARLNAARTATPSA